MDTRFDGGGRSSGRASPAPAGVAMAFLALAAGAFLPGCRLPGGTPGGAPGGMPDAPSTSPAAAGTRAVDAAPSAAPAALHEPYGRLLADCVHGSRVDYAALRRRRAELDAYLATLAATDPSGLDRRAALAFWINASNALTLRMVLDQPAGLASVMDIPVAQRWNAERWEVRGQRLSLEAITNGILRPLGDPRALFALCLASRSGPDLAAEAYEPDRLDAQLDAAVARLLADRDRGLSWIEDEPGLLGESSTLRLSPLFDWYRGDLAAEGSLTAWLLRYAPPEAAAFLRRHADDLAVESLDYDWSLNGA